jgi:hypothetical protein
LRRREDPLIEVGEEEEDEDKRGWGATVVEWALYVLSAAGSSGYLAFAKSCSDGCDWAITVGSGL